MSDPHTSHHDSTAHEHENHAHQPPEHGGHAHGGHAHGGHDHGAAWRSAGAQHASRLWIAFGLVVGFFFVQVFAGFVTGSLALLSDAGHMATDAIGLGIALAAITLARKGSSAKHRTFGWYRLEILAALANAVLLLGVAVWVVIEAIGRVGDAPHIDGPVVLVVGVLGMIVNLIGFALLRSASEESMNVEGAYLEVLADLVGSVAVVIGAAVIWTTGWAWVDPLLGAAIGLWIVPRAWRLGAKALRVLTQSAGPHLDLDSIAHDLAHVPNVQDVHDVHVWTLTSGMDVATAHLRVDSLDHAHQVLDDARHVLATRHHIDHATLQVEPADHHGCEQLTW
jgi:cobalt-zinc-cadmium efflux system protein